MMMGCGSSMDVNNVTDDVAHEVLHQNGGINKMQKSTDIVKDFVRLDVQIAKLEATCPGPRMATAEAWIEHLTSKRNALLGLEGLETTFDKMQLNKNDAIQVEDLLNAPNAVTQNSDFETINADTAVANGQTTLGNGNLAVAPTHDLANLALHLGVVVDLRKASNHEDFFANLSESALQLTTIRYYNEVLEHTKVRLKTLTESYAELNELYVNHDGIIALISGGTYMTRLEESLDAQLETARDVRDKLGSALEQWRICGLLLRACANSATLGLQQWRDLAKINNPKDKIHNTLQCRNTLQASLISLDCAQLALPHVEIKFISNRQLLAVKHCNTYIITDIADKARYEHTSKVIVAYESNMSKASTWLYETFNNTLRKDFDKAQQTVEQLAQTLREHREELFAVARAQK